MARHATIIGHCRDIDGYPWDIREARPTPHGFSVLIGWPAGCRGRGFGGPSLIPTPELFAYWDARRLSRDGSICALPIARGSIQRVRRLMGFNSYLEHEQWWLDRLDDLASLSGADFIRKHGRHSSQVASAHKAFFGRRLREPGWYRDEPAYGLLTSELPHAYIAEKLGISRGASGRLRSMLLGEGLLPCPHQPELRLHPRSCVNLQLGAARERLDLVDLPAGRPPCLECRRGATMRRRLLGFKPAKRRPSRHRNNYVSIEAVRELRLKGLSYTAIARELDCASTTVRTRLRQAQALGLLPPELYRPAKQATAEESEHLRAQGARVVILPPAPEPSPPQRRRRPKKPEITADRVLTLLHQGKTNSEIAAELGCSTRTVWLRKRAVGAPHGLRRLEISIERILAMRAQGKSYGDIARELGCSAHLLYRRLREAHAAGLLPPGVYRPYKPRCA